MIYISDHLNLSPFKFFNFINQRHPVAHFSIRKFYMLHVTDFYKDHSKEHVCKVTPFQANKLRRCRIHKGHHSCLSLDLTPLYICLRFYLHLFNCVRCSATFYAFFTNGAHHCTVCTPAM